MRTSYDYEDMRKVYLINGWSYGKEYFYSLGRFTDDEKRTLYYGDDVVEKNGNTFYIALEKKY